MQHSTAKWKKIPFRLDAARYKETGVPTRPWCTTRGSMGDECELPTEPGNLQLTLESRLIDESSRKVFVQKAKPFLSVAECNPSRMVISNGRGRISVSMPQDSFNFLQS